MPVAAVGGVPPGHGQPPTCFQKIRMGFMMGCMIGGATGVLIGGFSALRMGLRGKELLIQITFSSVIEMRSFYVYKSLDLKVNQLSSLTELRRSAELGYFGILVKGSISSSIRGV
ncbi:hypothetical protein ANCCEY_01177 [Ancylostoma ceylanicum]|uniref:Reactive oxygen species modulator 1 n=1 Tax=Ancylostoma ceylanicum TaxID=53326 RepID=A0A0D6M8K9_9BILA|nr:hypothetical protein ANCCEY_01177 [Ancylostoma ceylanicum]